MLLSSSNRKYPPFPLLSYFWVDFTVISKINQVFYVLCPPNLAPLRAYKQSWYCMIQNSCYFSAHTSVRRFNRSDLAACILAKCLTRWHRADRPRRQVIPYKTSLEGDLKASAWPHWIYTKITQITYCLSWKNVLKLKMKLKVLVNQSQNFGTLIMLRCILSLNLKIRIWIDVELRRGQAQNRVNFDFRFTFDIEIQSQSTPKALRILTKVLHFWFKFGDSNWNEWRVILLRLDTHTQTRRHTHRQTQATITPEGQTGLG